MEKIVAKLEGYLGKPETLDKLCTWHPEELPRGMNTWQMLERMSQAACKKRVEKTIKVWEADTQAIQNANRNLLQGMANYSLGINNCDFENLKLFLKFFKYWLLPSFLNFRLLDSFGFYKGIWQVWICIMYHFSFDPF